PRHPTLTLFPYTTLFRSRLCSRHHRAPAGSMDRQDRRLERRERRYRLADRVRDVVELEIEENRQSNLGYSPDARRPLGGEEFEADRKSTRLNSSHVAISY